MVASRVFYQLVDYTGSGLETIHVKATANEWSGVFLDFRMAES